MGLCVKASGAILSQASKHDPDHGDRDPGLFTAGEHLIVMCAIEARLRLLR